MKTTAILLAAAASAAFAAAPAAAEAPSGVRVEAVAGIESATFDHFGSRNDVSESGAVFGLGVGYDIPIGPAVALGIDLEATDGGTGFRETSTLFSTDLRTDFGRDLYAGGRITVAASPNLNVYAKAGYTSLRIRSDFTSPTFSEVIESDEDGVRAGAGLQIGLGSRAYVGAEYRFSTYDGDLTRHQGVGTLGFRF
jgi:outer membrane immunogenic protein